MNKKKILFIFTLALSHPAPSKENPSIIIKRDVLYKMNDLMCKGYGNKPNAVPHWNFGLYDSQIIGININKKNHLLTAEIINAYAQKFTSRNNYKSYMWGICRSKDKKTRGWVLSFLSPKPLVIHDDIAFLPHEDIVRFCSKTLTHFAPISRGPITKKIYTESKIRLQDYPPGTLSLLCKNKIKHTRKSEQWFLLPTRKDLDLEKIPISNQLLNISNFISWINYIRSQHGLQALNENTVLFRFAKKLSKEQSIQHNLPLLRELKENGLGEDIVLLGENKVIGYNLSHMTKLLWLSPLHRKLLLYRNADAVGIFIEKFNNLFKSIIVIGKVASLAKEFEDSKDSL